MEIEDGENQKALVEEGELVDYDAASTSIVIDPFGGVPVISASETEETKEIYEKRKQFACPPLILRSLRKSQSSCSLGVVDI